MSDRSKFLPVSQEDMARRGWKECDIILVTGDAYVDHPSYGTALIGRVLEDAGFRVGVMAQPDWKTSSDFQKLGRPRLFFSVAAGNMDSMVSNYTASKKPRRKDDYSPGGKPGLRPNRATIVYTSKIKGLFPGVPVVIGGIEASLRRLAHFDYWDEAVRRSVLVDSKADMLIYGMAEKQIVEVARRMDTLLKSGPGISRPALEKGLDNIRGTAVLRNGLEGFEDAVMLPSFDEVSANPDKFNEAFRLAYLEGDPVRGRPVVQKYGNRFLIQQPPPFPLTTAELDHIYQLPFVRAWHPLYDKQGGVPGFETVRFSITAHRGCAGECSFCSLFAHQGRMIQSRSKESILKEVRLLAGMKEFKGTITDIGGPTANLYGAECDQWGIAGACRNKQCMMPSKCGSLKLGYEKTVALWNEVLKIPNVKHLFVQSGLRYDLLVDKTSDGYLEALCRNHVSGQLKVAPEHASEPLLKLMNKPSMKVYEKFRERFRTFSARAGKEQYLVNYWICSHPGSGVREARELAAYLKEHRLHPEQVQDFMPLPMTVSSCMYYTGKHPFTGEAVASAKTYKEREAQRLMVQPKLAQRRTGNAQRKN
ncbi:MAG TPA: YgiQ family radical SAM protein [Candidatus Omnitrophota bacterium]|nr:YgiQ family radical SAM protein [Candidatus Omnitrophota bacterium]HPS36264.1 YgiQ family radical SAM protein [Candidatus Omnitrophota bacterium]